MCKIQRNHSTYLPINSSECHFFDEIVNNFVFQIDAYRIKTNIYIEVVNRIINLFLYCNSFYWSVRRLFEEYPIFRITTYKLLDFFSLFSKIFKKITGTGKVIIRNSRSLFRTGKVNIFS